MSSVSNQNKIIETTEDDDLSVWHVPNVEQKLTADQEKLTNAIGKSKQWRFEPPEEAEPEPIPLTAEQIEEIRQAAYEEGFHQGKEEGFAKGYDEGKATGHEEGLKTGHEAGVATGLEEGQQTIESLSEQWKALIEQLHHPLSVVEKDIETQLLELVVQLTEAIVLQEAKTNPDILTDAISTGMKALPSQESQTQILLHPDDIKLVESQFGEEYVKEQGWRLLAAPQLEHGSCQIENSTSNIDLRVKSRIKQVLDSFLQEALHQ